VRILDIYTRVSHKSDKRILSTAGQEACCRERVARAGAELGRVFTDPAQSAWNPKVHRPDWEDLMLRLERGESDGVVVFDLPRFARRPADGERLIAAAERGLSILDEGSEYDLTTASGRKNFRDNMNGAAYYSDMISESSRRGKQYKASQGEVDRRRSFGFCADGVTVNQEEASLLRDHARRLLAGETQDRLIGELNRDGVPSVRGARWGYTTYRQIMTRPRNAGLIQHNGQVVEGVRLPGEPILDDDTYHRIVALYAARRPGKQPSGRYMLTGIAACGLCGAGLSGRPVSGTNRRHYWCKSCHRVSVDVRRLDDWAADWAIDVLSDAATASTIEREERERAEHRAELEREIASRKELKLLLADRLGRGEMDLDEYDAAARPIAGQVAKLRAEIDALSAAEPAPESGSGHYVHTPRDYERLTLLERFDAGDPVECRGIVKMALRGRRIVVGPGRAARFDPERVAVV
jgi:DNA invertase Pin-like site-specific DNA recombinase